jgi:hypothetical protein
MNPLPASLTGKLVSRVGQGSLAFLVLFIAHWPLVFSAALISRALHGGEAAPAFVVTAALGLLAVSWWRERIYRWFAQSATAGHMGL